MANKIKTESTKNLFLRLAEIADILERQPLTLNNTDVLMTEKENIIKEES